jgi:hypothetical protein
VKGALLLDVVVRQGSAVFELLSGEDKTLLIWWDSFLVLDLRLHVVNGIGALNFQGDGLSGKSLDEDLHTTTETKDEMESGLLLDVVIRKSAAILELLASKDQALLVWGNALLILDLGLDIVNGVAGLDLESDGLSSEGLDKDLHTTAETEDKMEGGLLLDIVVRKGTAVLELLAGKDETLLIWRNAFLILDLGLDVVNGVAGLDLEGDGLAGEGLYKDLHGGESMCRLGRGVCVLWM